ncbi:MAG TPA: ATP-binding protein [Casimicrobium huifangae]|nr:ATP-binding protein [Casimicrobium huifangae]
MTLPSLNESFWPDIQSLIDRRSVVEDASRQQRKLALAVCGSQLGERLSRLLRAIDVTALLHRCRMAQPPLGTDRAEDLLNTGQWRRQDGLFLRAFYVLNRLNADGRRCLALATGDVWTESCITWHCDESTFRGFLPIIMLELVEPDRRHERCSTGQRYTLFLHPDRIRFAHSDLVVRDAPLLQVLGGLHAVADDLPWLNRLARPALPGAPLLPAQILKSRWSSLVLPPSQKEALARLQSRCWVNEPGSPRSLLISGQTGVGKTRAVQCLLSSIRDADTSVIRLDDLLTRHDTVNAAIEQMASVWTRPESLGAGQTGSEPRILLLEDCEHWFGMGREGSASDSMIAPAVLRAFIHQWDQALAWRDEPIKDSDGGRSGEASPRVLLVATTRHPERLDPALRSRFDAHVALSLPDAACRQELLLRALSGTIGAVGGEASYPTAEQLGIPTDTLTALVRVSQGLNGRELVVAVQQAMDGRTNTTAALVEQVLARLQHQRQQENPTVDNSARWDRLVLPTATRETLQDLVFQLQEAPALRAAGFKPATAVLLYGPPGTGKTQSARTLANEAGMAFVAASTAELKAGYIGQSGERVRELFSTARQRAPSILFLDEIDAVGTDRRSGSTDSFNREVVTQLLQELDGVRDHSAQSVLVIAATNCYETLDPALLSRFREKVLMDLPTPSERLQLLEILLAAVTVETDARELMCDWVRSGVIDGQVAGPNRGPTETPRSHRDVEQWVNRVLALSVRRWRITRSEREGLVDTVSLTQALRVTSADVLASLGIQATGFATSSQRDGIDGKPWRAAA